MIEFHAGTGPDTQAIGIALEELFLSYRIAERTATVPVTIVGHARLPGANNVLMALARQSGKFMPKADEAAPWLSKDAPAIDALEAQLAGRDFIFGLYTVADMAMYPRVVKAGGLARFPNVAAWAERMKLRPAVGRGMGAVNV